MPSKPVIDTAAMEEVISELAAKCDSYKKDIEEIRQEKQSLEMEIGLLHKVDSYIVAFYLCLLFL